MFMRSLLPDGPIWYVTFLFSITCHEAAHALAAKWGGDDTAYESGQVSLNPVPHMQREPFGTIVVPILSFVIGGWMIGWASAPYDPTWQARHPHRAGWMALAGPAANFIVVILTGIGIRVGMYYGVFTFPPAFSFTQIVVSGETGGLTGLSMFVSVLFSLNLLLGTFNLLPVPPLDGATVLGLLFSEETALKIYEATRQPGFQLVGLLIAWNVFDRVFLPVFVYALKLLYSL